MTGFTGQLGTSDSELRNVELGFEGGSGPIPTPPPGPLDGVFTGQLGTINSKLANIVLGTVPTVFVPPPVSGDLYFIPPISLGTYKMPPRVRLDRLGVPKSGKYRSFLRTPQVPSTPLVVGGIEYLGGRWHGPLTAQQVSDLTAAGYDTRIYQADEPGHLPVVDNV